MKKLFVFVLMMLIVIMNSISFAQDIIIGKSKIIVPYKSIVGTQIDRVIRDIHWKDSAYDERVGVDRTPIKEQLVPYMEGRLSGILMDYANVKIIGLSPAYAEKKADGFYYSTNGKGEFTFKVCPSKVKYKTALCSGNIGIFTDTHGFNMVAGKAIQTEGVRLVIACMDLPSKAQAALYLAKNGINSYGPCDRYAYELMGYKDDFPNTKTIIGTAPIRRHKQGAVIGDQSIRFSSAEIIVVQTTNKPYPDQYCDTPDRYFTKLSEKYNLNLPLVRVNTKAGEAYKVVGKAEKLGTHIIGVRIWNEEDATAVSNWLKKSSKNRAVLFHSAAYTAGYNIFFRFPKQTSFGDLSPIIAKKPIITFTFDDGRTSVIRNALPLFKKYNIKATTYIITGKVGSDNNYYMNWDQINILSNNGWEVGAHTHTHPYLTKITNKEVIHELDESIKCFEEHGFHPISFASPYGNFNDEVIKEVEKRFQSHRTAWDVEGVINKKGLNQVRDPFYISAFELKGTTTVNEAKEMVDIAVKNKTWLVFFLHSVKTDGEIGRYEYSAEKLEEIVKYIVDKGVEVLPLSNALRIKKGGSIL